MAYFERNRSEISQMLEEQLQLDDDDDIPHHLPVFERLADEVDMAEERAARQEPPDILWNTNDVQLVEANPRDDVIEEQDESDESD